MLNERGYERFAATTLDRVNCTLAATETFNERNGNATLEEAVRRVQAIVTSADKPVTITISCAFGCPFEGEVDPGAVAALCERLDGADELVLADTIGVATPKRVRRLVERVSILGRARGRASAQHAQHRLRVGVGSSRRGRVGARRVDRRSRRLPVLAERDGQHRDRGSRLAARARRRPHGIDVAALVEVSRWLEEMLGRRLEGYVYRAARWP